jgi:hypothetical protein
MYKAITIQQPDAWGVVVGQKRFENRSWETKHRGTLWIHAAKTRSNVSGTQPEHWCDTYTDMPETWDECGFGVVIGCVDLIRCIPNRQALKEFNNDQHINDEDDCWVFVLGNPRQLIEPIPYTGQLGLWNFFQVPSPSLFRPKPITKPRLPYGCELDDRTGPRPTWDEFLKTQGVEG